ncbi:hypothetical protein KCV03_g131, partial [Aureobasidium melanogenum]
MSSSESSLSASTGFSIGLGAVAREEPTSRNLSPNSGLAASLASACAFRCAFSSAKISSLDLFAPATGGGGAISPFLTTFSRSTRATSFSSNFSNSSSKSSSFAGSDPPSTSSPFLTRSSNLRSRPLTRCVAPTSPPVI